MSPTRTSSDARLAPEPRRTWREWLRWIAVEDHCEWANPYVAKLRTPLGVLSMGAVASLLCGLFVAPQGFAIFGAIVGVIALGFAWPWIAMSGVGGRLVFEAERGREGAPVGVRFVVTNRWPWPVWGLTVNEPSLSKSGAAETNVALARIDGWSRATFNSSFTPKQRGTYPRNEVRIGSGFPFGLYMATRQVEVKEKLLVWPQTFWLPALPDESQHSDWRGETSEACVGSQGTRMAPREHRHGDTLRDVHWSKSARYDRLIVSEREAATVETRVVCVDTELTRHSGEGADSTFEWSLRIAASIAEALVGRNGTVTVLLGDEPITARSPGAELRRLMDAIALFDPEDAAGANGAARRRPWGGSTPVVAIGTQASPMRTERFIELRPAGEASPAVNNAWIVVEGVEDVAGQVLRGWRVTSRRPHHAC